MEKFLGSLCLMITFTGNAIYSSDCCKHESAVNSLNKSLCEARQEIADLKDEAAVLRASCLGDCAEIIRLRAQNKQLDALRIEASNERTVAMLILLNAQSELDVERSKLKAAEREIERLKSLERK